MATGIGTRTISIAIKRLFSRHNKISYQCYSQYSTSRKADDFCIEKATSLIKSSRRILIICGAGISTPSGLPDFRTPGTGLYDNLQEYGLREPADVFDLRFFCQNPYPFFRLAKSLYPGNFKPNEIHYFMKLLSIKSKLLRVYTQNIDALEGVARIPDDEIVFAHGSFHTATCMACRTQYKGHEIKDDVIEGIVPHCRKGDCDGIIKPDIVFFGEDLPFSFHHHHHHDLQDCDVMLILGTSLQVFPVAGLVYQVPRSTPRFLMNNEVVEPFTGDYQTRPTDLVYCGDLKSGVCKLVDKLGWTKELAELIAKK